MKSGTGAAKPPGEPAPSFCMVCGGLAMSIYKTEFG